MDGGHFGEALDGEVGLVDLHDECNVAGWVVDASFVVGGSGAVGGPYFDEFGAALFHDVGDAESAADFDEFAAGDRNASAGGEGGEDQHDGRRAVVDNDC